MDSTSSSAGCPKTTATTCPYCGVGCGVLASVTPDETQPVMIKGDPVHPANLGRLCSKGTALGQTLGTDDRLLFPMVRGVRTSWAEALDAVADGLARIVRQHGPDSVAMYVSGQLLTEDYYVANKFVKGYLGTANIDSNSRLCMSSAVAGHKRAFGSDTVPGCYEDLERAQLIILTGSNMAWCHPVAYQRVVAAKQANPDLRVVVIDPRKTASCDVADSHLALRPGSDSVLFNGLLAYLADNGEVDDWFVSEHTAHLDSALAAAKASAPSIEHVASSCHLTSAQVAEFFRLFSRTERVVTVFSQGINQSSSGTDKVNAIINCHLITGRIGRPGMGPFSLTGQPNAMGGREVGGLSNLLAAHMELENPGHRQLVQEFWQSPRMAERPGLKAAEMFEAMERGQIKAIWIMATNPVVSLPDSAQVREALAKCELVVVSDIVASNDTLSYASIALPAMAWGEKDGTVTNSERRISRQRAFLPPPGEVRPDWWMICEVAKRMGFGEGFDFSQPADIFREHAKLSGYENGGRRDFDISELGQLTDGAYDRLSPVQWPIKNGRGTARMFADKRFFHPGGKANFVPVVPRGPKNEVDDSFPLILNTGRVRDHWHTMTRTGKAHTLSEHVAEPYVEIHPRDARRAGVTDGGLAKVFSRSGEVIVRVREMASQQPGSVFVPMHWNGQYASQAWVNALVKSVVDPVSGQPEFKQTPVRIIPFIASWHGFILSRRQLDLPAGIGYWARATGDQFYRYEIAGDQTTEDWPQWARQLLCASDRSVDWVEYHDARRHQYRGVRMVEKRVESCIFVAPENTLPSRSWLAGLFGKAILTEEEHRALLSGKPPVGQADAGKIVCACFSVGINTISKAIRDQNLSDVDAIGDALKAGTNCGSCRPELAGLIAAVHGH